MEFTVAGAEEFQRVRNVILLKMSNTWNKVILLPYLPGWSAVFYFGYPFKNNWVGSVYNQPILEFCRVKFQWDPKCFPSINKVREAEGPQSAKKGIFPLI